MCYASRHVKLPVLCEFGVFRRRDGWRSHGPSLRSFMMQFRGAPHTVVLTRAHGGVLQLLIDGSSYALSFASTASGALDVRLGTQRALARVYQMGEVAHVFTAQGAAEITVVDALAHAGESRSDAGRLTAPMPGKVVSFSVKAGDQVSKGQPLAVMEAMKMEHTIAAPSDGVVAELLYAPGDQVAEGAELIKLEAA